MKGEQLSAFRNLHPGSSALGKLLRDQLGSLGWGLGFRGLLGGSGDLLSSYFREL